MGVVGYDYIITIVRLYHRY